MRRTIVLAVACAAVLEPGSAAAAEMRLERLATSRSPAVASPEHKTSAYLSAPDTLVVGMSGRVGQSLPVAPGCVPAASTAGAVALTCNFSTGSQIAAVLDIAGRTVTPLQLPSGVTGRVTQLGTRWANVDARSSPDDLHVVPTRLLVEHTTQRTLGLGTGDPFGARRYIDLDAAQPGRPLCAPVRRTGSDDSGIRYSDLVKQGVWTLTYESVRGPLVQRCGQRTKLRLPRVSQPVLGTDFVGYVDGRRIIYLDLRTGTRRTRSWPTSQRPWLAAAGRRLIISAPNPDGTYRLYRSLSAAAIP